MSTPGNTFTQRLGNQSLNALADDTKRGVLAALADASGSLAEREIAAELATGSEEDGAATEDIRTVHTKLYHVHLPALDDAGLVSWDRSDETVAPSEHPLFDDARFEDLLCDDGTDWDDVRSCVTNEDRRAVLDILGSRTGRVSRAAVARELAAREAPGTPSADHVRDVEIQLHHVHLPKLDDAGLVDYDAGDETVARDGNARSAVDDLLVGA